MVIFHVGDHAKCRRARKVAQDRTRSHKAFVCLCFDDRLLAKWVSGIAPAVLTSRARSGVAIDRVSHVISAANVSITALGSHDHLSPHHVVD
jgi:hypothetical protein